MRTKALLGLAVLAAGAVTSVAQSNVYSLNIVGYVNVPIAGDNKLTLVSNPLKPSNGNYDITNTIVLPDTADGASVFTWTGSGWDSSPTWYQGGTGWVPGKVIPLGQSFFVQSPVATTITFVGEVSTGTNTLTVPPGISLIADPVPVTEAFPGKTFGNDGDGLFLWTGTGWDASWAYIGGTGWDNGAGGSLDGPTVTPGSGLVYNNTGTALTWTRVFNP